MRRYRFIGVVAFALTLAIGCSPNTPTPAAPAVSAPAQTVTPPVLPPPPIILSSEGFAGHSTKTGDTLTWTVLDEPTTSSYRLTFPKKNPACNLDPTAVVIVTPTQPFSCQAMAPTSGNAVYYKIKPIPTPVNPVPNPTPRPLPPNPIRVFGAFPCKICNQ
jgi:hypothetical protein